MKIFWMKILNQKFDIFTYSKFGFFLVIKILQIPRFFL